MTLHFEPSEYRSPRDLPDEIPPELRRIDDSLAELAARERMPNGLEDRIFRASVVKLPGWLRFRGRTVDTAPQRGRFHRAVWGQMAMAASVGLAFVVVAWFLSVPANFHERGNGMMADGSGVIDSGRVEPSIVTVAHQSSLLSRDAERLLFDFNGGGVGYLVDTRDMTRADLDRDLARLIDEFEL